MPGEGVDEQRPDIAAEIAQAPGGHRRNEAQADQGHERDEIEGPGAGAEHAVIKADRRRERRE